MATYVNDLRLTELATGEGSGTWGVTTNLNLELIGEALGYGTQDCFATDADATTTVADGASDPARAMYFKVTSSATLTATRTLTIGPNTVSRVMLIENATTGAQSIAISQGSGGNVTIANGAVKMVYLDGAGAGAAVVDALVDLDLTGTTTVANLTVSGTTSLAGASTTADITFGDNDKAIFGAGSDLQIYHSGSDSFITDTGAGDLKISGESQIKLGSVGGEFYATFNNNSSVNLYYDNAEKLATTATGIDVTGTVTADGLTVDTNTLHVDATNNRVGVGTSSPSKKLHVLGTGSTAAILLESSNATNGQITFKNTTNTAGFIVGLLGDSSGDALLYQSAAKNMQFWTNATERMRINSAGDWMAGNTAANVASNYSTQAGCGWVDSDTHFEIATTANRPALEIGKNNANDGAIITFRKQGTPVGSIGTSAGVLVLGNGNAGLYFNSSLSTVMPWNITGNTNSDAAIDIGQTSNRFKDLYLSGGVYLGGTGAGNLLDDYEEGTFTPTVASGWTGITYTIQSGSYTKIGKLVQFQISLVVDPANRTADANRFDIGGLPFTKTGPGATVSVWTDLWNMGGSNNTANGLIAGTEIEFYQSNFASGGESSLTGNEMDSSSGNEIYITGVYQAS